jgi:hypothetical protein
MDWRLGMQIDSLKAEDSKWRNLLTRVNNHDIDTISVEEIWIHIKMTDSLNYFPLQVLFNKHGFLGYDKAGEIGSNGFWLLVQHQDRHPSFQDSVLQAMELEVKKGNASKSHYAYLFDRVRLNTDRKQVYGTQMQLKKDSSSYETQATN